MLMKSSQNPLLTRRRGSNSSNFVPQRSRRVLGTLPATLALLLAASCANSSGAPGVIPGEPFVSPTAGERLAEYVALMDADQAPALRAWVREADRTIRANNEVYGIPVDAEEDLPWPVRAWRSFKRFFTGS